jgi:glycosyltransferase involved in cell wall biosynthesis
MVFQKQFKISQMKLAFISNVCGCLWAGSEELWLGAAMVALLNGHQVLACVHSDLCKSSQIKDFKNAGGTVETWSRGAVARFEGIRQKIHPNFSLNKLGRPDVVLVSAGALPAINYVPGLSRFLMETEIPFGILCQFNSDSLAMTPCERQMTRNLLNKSSFQIFVSQHNLTLAKRQFALELPKAEVIYNPIRTFLDAPLQIPDFQNGVVFGCVARFETLWKGQDLLIEILSKPPWTDRNWTLHLFGEGPDLEHVRAYTSLVGLGDRVFFNGYVRDLKKIWDKCHCMVLPSRGEGTPLAVLEAMMCGRPVVTTDVGGNREVLEEGVTGWIAEAATPASFDAALERAWNAKSKWAEMGACSHSKALEIAGLKPSNRLFETLVS